MQAPPRGTRPHNRRALIIAAAGELFAVRGYPHVGMNDIAKAVAIRPSALYRHFSGKQELLAEVVLAAFTSIRSTVEALEDGEVLDALAGSMLARRGLGVLWQRESRHLAAAAREPLRAELTTIACLVGGLVRRRRPGLDDAGADLLAWSALGAVMSVSYHRVRLPVPEFRELLSCLADSVIATELPAGGEPRLPVAEAALSTRDALLSAAVRMFAQRGYQRVSIDDVGAEAGIAGPSVYHHFPAKADLLAAPMADGARHLHETMTSTLAAAAGAPDALRGLLLTYAGNTLDDHYVIDLLISEIGQLPEPDQRLFRQSQRDYIAEWVRLLREVHPEMPTPHARVRVQAALTVTNDIARTPHLRALPSIDAALAAIGGSILDV
jgi:AcrR family transcriptional regulator